MANLLPPPPIYDQPGSFTWLEWYRELRNYVSQSGSVPWSVIDFAGSNITDIAVRNHNTLQVLQGGTTSQYYHLTKQNYDAISNSLEVLETSASVAIPTTPTILKPTTTIRSQGITYDSSTGVITFVNGGSYSLTLMLNVIASVSNRSVYFYADIDTGSGFAISRYSARTSLLTATTQEQRLFASSNYFAAGTKLRLYVWGSGTGMTLNSVDVPGTTAGTVTVPAVRLMWAGSL